MNYIMAFLVGGIICVIAQLLLDLTKLTPARILVIGVVLGVILGSLGIWDKLIEIAGAGATVPIIGFGNALAKGVEAAVLTEGFIGIFTGGFIACSGGVSASLIFGFIVSVLKRANTQN